MNEPLVIDKATKYISSCTEPTPGSLNDLNLLDGGGICCCMIFVFLIW